MSLIGEQILAMFAGWILGAGAIFLFFCFQYKDKWNAIICISFILVGLGMVVILAKYGAFNN
jgi:hypothetical protein